MTFRFGLKESIIQQISAIFAQYPQVHKARLYGSRAKGDYKTGSDIDLTLLGSEALTLKMLYKIMGELDDLLLPYKFDLSIFRDISDLDVVEQIQRVGVTFYQKAKTTTETGQDGTEKSKKPV
ncbi:MAG TPA: nucleotidyltransferase domain-containing protein [Thermoflexia bacterium]|nr:nucleotidyltransferase domain-containing protein [Thermoflexia bacterium]